MMKLSIFFLACMSVAVSHAFLVGGVGGYVDRPELIKDQIVTALTSFAAEKIAEGQNLFLTHLKVVRVQTQVVAGMNYKIDFVAEPVNGAQGQTTRCQVVIYVDLNRVNNLVQSQCQTS